MAGVNQAANSGGISRTTQMEAIVAEHQAALLRYATRIVNSPHLAQDVVQNVFIKLFRAWKEDTHPTEKLKAWLYRVTHNEAVDHVRRESRMQVLHARQAEDLEMGREGVRHNAATNDERKSLVLRALKKLHPREQQVVLLRMEEGLSYREIGQITGRSEGNIGNILHHAVKKLSNVMKSEGVTHV